MMFDSHAHYDDKAFDEDRTEILSSLPSMGVCGVINCASDLSSAEKSIAMAEAYPFVYAAAGVHPHEAEAEGEFDRDRLARLLSHPKTVALGEIGLDYHYNFSPKEKQLLYFEEQLRLSCELSLPVIVHDREAHQDTMTLLQKYRPKGVVHCYSGSVEMAKELIKMGLYLGLGGAVTFKNAKTPLEVAKEIPLEFLLLETDAPYMTPVPFRGKRCHSGLIKYTAEKIAEVRNVPVETVYETIKENTYQLFNISRE
ncbi:MAG: hydrolase TatD [Clostridiales bacterium 43-6]|nr:MAG: hydrolase TatD [Clostridiales bacterium 43-6]